MLQKKKENSNNVLVDFSRWISEIVDNNVIRKGREGLAIFCYDVPVLHVMWYHGI